MKKFLTVLFICGIILAFGVSCNSDGATEGKVNANAVYRVCIDGNLVSTDMNSSDELLCQTDVTKLYWFYKAEKTDGSFYKTGETTTWTPVKTSGTDAVLGLAGADLGLFSTGTWNFQFVGSTTNTDVGDSNIVYKAVIATSTDIPVTIANAHVHLTLNLEMQEDIVDTLLSYQIIYQNLALTSDDLDSVVLEIWEGDTVIEYAPNSTMIESNGVNYCGEILGVNNGTEAQPDYSLTEGKHTYTFKIKHNKATSGTDYEELASASIEFFVKKGYSTTLTGVYENGEHTYKVIIDDYKTKVVETDGKSVQNVSKTIVATTDTVLSSDVTLASDNKTTVTFPKGISSFTDNSMAKLTVEATPASVASGKSSFNISDTQSAVGAIDFTVKVGDVIVTEFKDANNQPVSVTIETYVAKNMTNVTVNYNGTGASPTDVSYDATTGKLTFKTTHFSTFLVGCDDAVYLKSANSVYTSLSDAFSAATTSDTIILLNDCETGDDIYGITEEATTAGKQAANPLVLSKDGVTLDLNGKTITVSHNYSFIIAGDNVVVKNGTIKSKEKRGDNSEYYRGYPLVVATLTSTDHADNVQVNNVEIFGGISAGGSAENNATPILGGGTVTLTECNIHDGYSHTLYSQLGSTLKVVSGTYNAGHDGLASAEAANAQHLGEQASSISITGGVFNSDPSSYVKSGYTAKENTPENGKWTVSTAK